jgi:hypothetical protein
MYRVAEGPNVEGWPFLYGGRAYLADGTPLIESDEYGRLVATRASRTLVKVACSGGLRSLAERREGIEALARALDKGDRVRAPLLMLLLQIDPEPDFSKYNHWHKPPGPGGGEFTSGPQAGGSAAPNSLAADESGLQPLAWNMSRPGGRSELEPAAQSMDVQFFSTFDPSGKDPEVIIAHKIVQVAVGRAILLVTKPGFTPGTPGYGQALDDALEEEILMLHHPMFHVKPVYLNMVYLGQMTFAPPGSSVPDVVYGPADHPLAVFDLKSGRAATNKDADMLAQKILTLFNVPGDPYYDYFNVVGK